MLILTTLDPVYPRACISATPPSSQVRDFWFEGRFPKTKSGTEKGNQPDMINIRIFLGYHLRQISFLPASLRWLHTVS